jgi:hypothetical protein
MKNLIFITLLAFSTLAVFANNQKIITVMDFKTSDVSQQEMTLFVDYISASVSDYKGYNLIDRRQREIILAEAEFSNSGCADETCAIEIGQLLSANEMIVGSLGSIEALVEGSETIIDELFKITESAGTEGDINFRNDSGYLKKIIFNQFALDDEIIILDSDLRDVLKSNYNLPNQLKSDLYDYSIALQVENISFWTTIGGAALIVPAVLFSFSDFARFVAVGGMGIGGIGLISWVGSSIYKGIIENQIVSDFNSLFEQ